MLDAWLRGPVEGVPPMLMPVAHALIQAADDVARATEGMTVDELWMRPGGVAAVGFHLKHVAGVTDRLLTYARGEELTEAQLGYLSTEAEPGMPAQTPDVLVQGVHDAVESALCQLRATDPDSLLEIRYVGRRRLESNVLGLLFHAADHAQRHAGQVVATAGIVRGGHRR